MTWHDLNAGGPHQCPRLECFDDAWNTLWEFKDVLAEMAKADGKNITPVQFCQLLDKCGFKDATKEKQP
jgi:hypothetical protein